MLETLIMFAGFYAIIMFSALFFIVCLIHLMKKDDPGESNPENDCFW